MSCIYTIKWCGIQSLNVIACARECICMQDQHKWIIIHEAVLLISFVHLFTCPPSSALCMYVCMYVLQYVYKSGGEQGRVPSHLERKYILLIYQ